MWHFVTAASQTDAHPGPSALRNALNEKGESAKQGGENEMHRGLVLMSRVIVSLVIDETASGTSWFITDR